VISNVIAAVGRTVLIYIDLRKQDGRIWAEFVWLGIGTSGGLF
jgi:hypothetical protein